MALAFSLVTQEFVEVTASSRSTSSVTTASDELYVIDVISNLDAGSNVAPTSVAGAGLTFSKIAEGFLDSGSTVHVSRWRAESTAVNSAAITITWSANRNDIGYALHRITGYSTGSNGANAFNSNATSAYTAGAGASQSLTLSALVSSSNAALAAFFYGSGTASAQTGTAGNSFTELGDVSVVRASTFALGLETQYKLNASDPAVTWSGTPDDRAAYAHEILAAAAPPATTPGTLGMWDPCLRIEGWF